MCRHCRLQQRHVKQDGRPVSQDVPRYISSPSNLRALNLCGRLARLASRLARPASQERGSKK